MTDSNWGNVYKKLGTRPVINATGNQTVRGGYTTSHAVRKAMEEASASYVEMEELLAKSGEHIASLLGVEAAYITAGCYAALALPRSIRLTTSGGMPSRLTWSVLAENTSMRRTPQGLHVVGKI